MPFIFKWAPPECNPALKAAQVEGDKNGWKSSRWITNPICIINTRMTWGHKGEHQSMHFTVIFSQLSTICTAPVRLEPYEMRSENTHLCGINSKWNINSVYTVQCFICHFPSSHTIFPVYFLCCTFVTYIVIWSYRLLHVLPWVDEVLFLALDDYAGTEVPLMWLTCSLNGCTPEALDVGEYYIWTRDESQRRW